MSELVTLLLKIPRNTQVTPESAKTMLSALTKINTVSTLDKIFFGKKTKAMALEIALINQEINFLLTADSELIPFIESQIQSNYPLCMISKTKDPLLDKNLDVISLGLSRGSFYPLATIANFTDIDPLSSVLTVLTKGNPEALVIIQIALEAAKASWQDEGRTFAEKGSKNEDGTYTKRPDANIITEKINYPGFKASVRIIGNTNKTQTELLSALSVFSRSDGNSLSPKKISILDKKREIEFAGKRRVLGSDILNIEELATLWHLPSEKIKVPGITWGSTVLSEPPTALPTSEKIADEEKSKINFFAKTLFKNHETIFGIKDKDRLRHIWTVGKTGTGKSTMIANMAIDDLKKGRGVAILDPHGDLVDDVLDYIPAHRINDTIYFNPADRDFPITLNPLEVTNREEAELVASGLMSIFTKVWANVWSARMEYILRNCFMTLAAVPDTTLEDVLKILANTSYRNKILEKVDDGALQNFWKDEFEKMPPMLQKEAIAPIQNKVGQFVTSPLISRIIGKPKSTINIDEIMDDGKIILANLSQGRLGEDNSALLGAMLITKFELSAMRRVDRDKASRRPFYLYVDEFQNFATDSFIKILSEARKYGLALTLANQYMAQIPENVRKAILGNAGTLISFGVGAEDASLLNKEFGEVFSQIDLINLENYQIAVKLMIDGYTSRPFLARTLPLPISRNQNRAKVIKVSQERWGKKAKGKIEEDETQLSEQLSTDVENKI